MGLSITPAASAARFQPLWDTGGPVIAVIDQPENPAASGPARPMSMRSKRAGEAQLLALREIIAAEAAHHRQNRQSKLASTSEAELRRLNHMILRAGIAQRAAAGRAK